MKTKSNKILIASLMVLTVVGVAFGFRLALAQSTREINVSAYLVNSENKEITNGEYEVRFALYASDRSVADPYPSTGDARVWEEVQKVKLQDGFLNAYLGAVNPIPANINFSNNVYYLGIRMGEDSEMVPRKRIGAAPLAIDALSVSGSVVGTGAGNIVQLGNGGKIDIGLLPTGTSGKKLVLAQDLPSEHDEVTFSGNYDYLTLSGQEITLGQINLNTDVSGNLSIARGGTGLNSFTKGDLTYYDSGSSLSKISIGAEGQVLTVNGGIPVWKNQTGTLNGLGVAGHMTFWTDTDEISYDNNGNFYWDAVNNRLGIGTVVPSKTLDVVGDITFSGDLTPSNANQSIGEMFNRFEYGYFENLDVTNLNIAGVDISGTVSNVLTLNSDNVTNDTEDSYLAFDRGENGGVQNSPASIQWNSTDDTFELNFPLDVNGIITATGGTSTNWNAAYTYRLTGVTNNATGLTLSLAANNLTAALTAGYVIPTTTQETNWNTAYTHSGLTSNVHGLTFTAEGSGGGLDADLLDGHDTSYFQTALSTSGSLIDLTGSTIKVKEGTLTDGRICTYSSVSGLVCTTTTGSVGVNHWTLNGSSLYPNDTAYNVGIGTTAPGTALDVNGVITATGGTSTNWNTAYGWGDHSAAGYFVKATDDLDDISAGTTNVHLTTTLKSNYDAAYTYRLTGVTNNATGLTLSLAANNLTAALTAGYVIPTTTQETNWNTAYTHSGLTSNVHGLTFTAEGSGGGLDADLLDGHDTSYFQTALTNPVTGTGTTNYLSKFTGTSAIGNSLVYDNGTNVGIGTTAPSGKLDVITGTARFQLSSFADGGGANEGITLSSSSGSGAAPVVRLNYAENRHWEIGMDSTVVADTTSEFFVGSWNGSSIDDKIRMDMNGKLILGNQIGTPAASTAQLWVTANAGLDAYSGYLNDNSSKGLLISNSNTGNAAGARLEMDADSQGFVLEVFGSGHATYPNQSWFYTTNKGQINIGPVGTNASGITITSGNNPAVGINTGNATIRGILDVGKGTAGLPSGYNTGIAKFRSLDEASLAIGSLGSPTYASWIQSGDSSASSFTSLPLLLQPSGGYVGIGTTSPATALDVNGVITATGGTSTNWNDAYSHSQATSDVHGLTFTAEGSGGGLDADLLDGHDTTYFQTALTNPVTGTGTTNYLSKFTGTSTIGNSLVYDNGTNVGIGTTAPGMILDVIGNIRASSNIYSTYVNGSYFLDDTNNYWYLSTNHFTYGSNFVAGWASSATVTLASTAPDIGMSRLSANKMAIGNGTQGDYTGILIAGNIGIGTTNPTYNLDVTGTGRFTSTDNPGLLIGDGTTGYLGIGNATISKAGGALTFSSSGYFSYANATTNTVANVLTLNRGVSGGSGANGVGTGLLFIAEDSAGNAQDTGKISGLLSTATSGLEQSAITFQNIVGGAALSEVMRIDGSNVGIGTTAPGTALDVNGVITATGGTSTNWNSAYTHSGLTSNVHGLTFTAEGTGGGLDADLLDGHEATYFQTALTNPVTGTGTTNYLSKFTGTSAIGNSLVYDNGTNIGIGTTVPGAPLHVFSSSSLIQTMQRNGVDKWDFLIGSAGNGASADSIIIRPQTNNSHVAITNYVSDAVKWWVSTYDGSMYVAGNVGIGTTAPATALDVNGVITATGGTSTNWNDAYTYRLTGVTNNATGLTLSLASNNLTAALTSGYIIPTTAQETNWNTAYTHSGLTSNVHGLTFTAEGTGGGLDADLLDGHEATYFQTALTNPVTGTGTTNYLSKFTGTSAIGNSLIYDNGTNVGIGTTAPNANYLLDIVGSARTSGNIVALTGAFVGNGSAGTPSYNFASDTSFDTGIFRAAENMIGFSTAGSERVRIDSSGYVGIGTTAPATALDVNGVITATGGTSTNWNDAYTYRLTGVTNNATGLTLSLASNNLTAALTSGYVIPTTTQETNWNTAYTHSGLTSNVHGLTFTAEGTGGGLDADLLDGQHASYFQTALTNPVTGTGTTNYLSKFTGTSTIGSSLIYDNGTNVGIGTTAPEAKLDVVGNTRLNLASSATGLTLHRSDISTNDTLMTINGGLLNIAVGGTSIFNLAGDHLTLGAELAIGHSEKGVLVLPNAKYIGGYNAAGTDDYYIVGIDGNDRINFSNSQMVIDPIAGYVGIGTTAPGTALDVNGVITATGGTSTNWNDAYTYRLTGVTNNATGLTLSLASNNLTAALTSGYVIPTTTQETNWNTAYTHSGLTSNVHGLTFTAEGTGGGLDADLLDGYEASAFQLALTNPVTGTGTTNYLSKFTGTSTIGSSLIYDNGTNVGIGTTAPSQLLEIYGANQTLKVTQDTTSSGGATLWLTAAGAGSDSNAATIKMHSAGSFWSRTDLSGIRFGSADKSSAWGVLGSNVGIGTTSPTQTLEVNGVSRFDNTVYLANGTTYYINSSGTGNLNALTLAGGFTANGAFTLGDNGDTGSVNTSDWDISTTGAMTGISGITNDSIITSTGGIISLNASSNYAVNIATGTSTGAISIGGGSNTVAVSSTSWDVSTAGAFSGITTINMSGQLTSTLATGTSPFAVTSTTVNTNLNADLLDGQHGTYYATAASISGTDNYIPRFNGTSALENSIIYDNGTNVGIGTTAPGAKLQIASASEQLRLNYDSSNYTSFSSSSSGSLSITPSGGNLAVQIGTNEGSMAIYNTYSGTIQTLKMTNLQAAGSGIGSSFGFYGTSSSYTMGRIDSQWNGAASTDSFITFSNRGNNTVNEVMRLASTGNVGIGTTAPGTALQVNGVITATGGTSTNWNTAYSHSQATSNVHGLTFTAEGTGGGLDADLLDGQHGTYYATAASISGTDNYIPRFNGTSALENSIIYDNGTNVGIGTTSPTNVLQVKGGLLTAGTTESYAFSAGNSNADDFTIGSDSSFSYLQSWHGKALQINNQGNNTILNPTSGYVGIGTTAPGAKLDVITDAENTVPFRMQATQANGFSGFNFYNNSGTLVSSFVHSNSTASVLANSTWLGTRNAESLHFTTNGTTPRMTINSTGYVGIGTTAPGTALDVNGVITATGGTSTNWNDAYTYRFTGVTNNATGLTLSLASNNLTAALTSGYVIPTTTQETNWNTAYTHSGLTTNVHGLTFTAEGSGGGLDADLLDGHDTAYFQTALTNPVTGTGTTNYLSKFTGTSAIGNSLVYDNGTNVGIGTTAPGSILHVSQAGTGAPTFERSGASADTVYISQYLLSTKTTSMNDGFGTSLSFLIMDNAAVPNVIANIGAARSGADNSGALIFQTASAGTITEKMRITPGGNVGIGTTAPAELLDVNGRIHLAQTTAPSPTTDRLYNVSGNLTWNGINLTAGGALPVGTEGQLMYSNAGAWTSFSGMLWNDTNSRLGIGTTNPGGKLDLLATSGSQLRLSYSDSVYVDFTVGNTGNLSITSNTAGATTSIGAGTDVAIKVDGSGNVGIGTTNPGSKLSVYGGVAIGTYSNLVSPGDGVIVSGNVGIGTTSPNTNLVVSAAGANGINLGADTGDATLSTRLYISTGTSGQSGVIRNSAGDIIFSTAATVGTDSGTERIRISSAGKVGIGTTAPLNSLDIGNSGGIHIASGIPDSTNYALYNSSGVLTWNGTALGAENATGTSGYISKFGVTNSLGDSIIYESSGKIGIGTTAPGQVLDVAGQITFGTSGNTFSTESDGEPLLAGTARHSRQVSLNAEYSGAVLTAFYGAGTDTSISGTMVSDTEPSTDKLRNYYEWNSSETSLNYYTVAVRVTLPPDFDGWNTSNAVQVDIDSESTSAADNLVDIYIYNGDDTPGTVVASSTSNVSSSADTWSTVSIDDSAVDDASAPDWDANTTPETAVIYLRLGSKDDNFVRIGDIRLNYYSKW